MTKKQSPSLKAKADTQFKDRNLIPVNPLKKQFEPTPAAPVRQRFKMAGGCD